MGEEHVLTLTAGDSGAVQARSSGGGQVNGTVVRSRRERDLLALFADWARGGKLESRREYEVFGALLWDALFPPQIEQFFHARLQAAKAAAAELRLRLVFEGDAHALATLPWEYLYRPATDTRPGRFLATDASIVLCRYVPLEVDEERLAPRDPPLRLLIVTVAPADLGPVMFSTVVSEIETLRAPLGIEISHLEDPTVDDFLDGIEQRRPHIVHLIGHGRFDADAGGGAVALMNDDRATSAWIGDDQFAEMFQQMNAIPRVVVLHMCEGAHVDFDEDFAGVAPQLARSEVQAVVAMQYPISNGAATRFSVELYKRLAAGESVDDSVQRARFKLTLGGKESARTFGIPVLYLRSRDGVLQEMAA
jgi:CHAT domain-containing protein